MLQLDHEPAEGWSQVADAFEGEAVYATVSILHEEFG